MAKRVTGLGRGLEALLPTDNIKDRLQQIKNTTEVSDGAQKTGTTQIQELPLGAIRISGEQPRKYFDELTISELAQSIFEHGLLQPILVMPLSGPDSGKYQIIAGERRFRACRALKWQRIPAIVQSVSEIEHFELALIENIQREDLTPIDEALAYEHLLRLTGLSQAAVAKRLGKGRSTLANSLRLLQLPPAIQEGLSHGAIRSGHARALLTLQDPEHQLAAYRLCVAESWSVRQVEQYCQQLGNPQLLADSDNEETHEQRAVPLPQTYATPPNEEVAAKNATATTSPASSGAIPQAIATETRTAAPPQSAQKPEYWGVSGMLFREEELEGHLAKALKLDLKLRLEGNLNATAAAARPRKALLQIEFRNQEQWEFLLDQLGLAKVLQALDVAAQNNSNEKHNREALFPS